MHARINAAYLSRILSRQDNLFSSCKTCTPLNLDTSELRAGLEPFFFLSARDVGEYAWS